MSQSDDQPRLIERAFPLKQTSLDSVHEKNVRHGHISTLHIWPARRPLAACRAALIATLLPDPGNAESRKKLCEKIGGVVVSKPERKKMPNGQTVERLKEETAGGILHWKRETENAAELEWFRQEIRKAHGGRAPRVLDPFAGGGAIPLEAMRLGCETTAADINPVAWFILKCTLEYPQKLAGKTLPLPEFILEDEDFMGAFLKAHPQVARPRGRAAKGGMVQGKLAFDAEGEGVWPPHADLAWQVRAWGRWVLAEARRELARFYPMHADFEPLKVGRHYESQPMRLVPLKADGTADSDLLNGDFSPEYLGNPLNPRWVAKPTVAYLWARTVNCKNCRATIPLLKTRWLCRKDGKRVSLSMEPNADRSGVVFGIFNGVPLEGGNAAQRRENDKRLGAGTMSKAGAQCPCCGAITTMEDLRFAGRAGKLDPVMTAVVVDGLKGKEYRLPRVEEIDAADISEQVLEKIFAEIPFGLPNDPTPRQGPGAARAFSVDGYGLDTWRKVFTHRQLMALGTLVQCIRRFHVRTSDNLAPIWKEAICGYLTLLTDKLADYNSSLCTWHNSGELISHSFPRFALSMTWDYVEIPWINDVGGALLAQLEWITLFVDHGLKAACDSPVEVIRKSATAHGPGTIDVIVTDPPYYDAIPYSDLMDFFYLWQRRSLHGLSPEIDTVFADPLGPKWNHDTNDGELIDDASRFNGDRNRSKTNYEEGMARAFKACHAALAPAGRLVVVFAHKHPDAWETLVAALIQSGFVVDASWPIQTEMANRTRAMTSAALASSIWLVCKKRPLAAKAGWDNRVLEAMRANVRERLREYWDAGIRGPDFVWAATGPALEAYSRHPVVKKANDPGQIMGVGEFLAQVRRMVVDFVVGRMLSGDREGEPAAERLDAPTAYYLLHRHDFGLTEAPTGACILYATACGLADRDLETTWDLLVRTGGGTPPEEDEESDADDPDADPDTAPESGGKVKLKGWSQRKRKGMGFEAPAGQTIPLIDRVHRLLHLWREGDVVKVDGYLHDHGLWRQELFKRLLQSLIELAPAGDEERSLLESLSNHLGARGAIATGQSRLALDDSV